LGYSRIIWGYFRPLQGCYESFRGHFGHITLFRVFWKLFWAVSRPHRTISGYFGNCFGPLRGHFDATLGSFQAILGRYRALMGHLGVVLGHLGVVSGGLGGNFGLFRDL
jgi:hypothetical protein